MIVLTCLPAGKYAKVTTIINFITMRYEHKHGVELEALLQKISKNKELLHEFLFDILSPVEYKELAVRWQIVKMLKSNTPHRDIAKNLKTSIATVTRGSRELMNKKGGFNRVWEKYYQKPSA